MSDKHQSIPSLRMAELLASLSLAIDLGVGQPMEWVLRSCLLAARMSDALGLPRIATPCRLHINFHNRR